MKFKLTQKAKISDDDTQDLIITGIASDTSTDRYDEYITPGTLESLCEQAKKLNLHYNHEVDYVIGTITDSWIKNNQLYIKAHILPDYADKLKEHLEFGINYGLSISGIAQKNQEDGALTSYDLVEISLTEEPANANTYATVQISNKSLNTDCFGGLCYIVEKEDKNMPKEDNEEVSTEYVTVDDLNNALNEYKEELLNTLRDELKDEILKEVFDELDDFEESEEEEESKVVDVSEKLIKALDERFTEFEEKHYKNLDSTRNPNEHKFKFKKHLDEDSSKKSIRAIAESLGGQ
jgi:phage head maturation protease